MIPAPTTTFSSQRGFVMRDRSLADEDRRPVLEDGARAARIHRIVELLAAPCPSAARSSRVQARWDAFLAAQGVAS